MKHVIFFLSVFIVYAAIPAQACTQLNHMSLSDEDHYNMSVDPELQSKRDQCLSLPASYKKILCLEPYFIEITNKYSADYAVSQAEGMSSIGIIDDCHLVAHMVGKANARKFDFDMNKVMASCPLNCIQGCVHGAIQTYISEKVKPEDLSGALASICEGVKDDLLMRTQCVHGVGHGFLTNDYMSLEKGIEACNQFSGHEVNICLSGLFMENMQRYLLLSEEELKEKLPIVCAKTLKSGNVAHIHECHAAIGEGLMFRTAHNLDKSLKLCELVSEEQQHKSTCRQAARIEEQIARSSE